MDSCIVSYNWIDCTCKVGGYLEFVKIYKRGNVV